MLRFAQKLSDNAEKIIFTLISKINKLEKLLSEETAEFYFFFKICNFFSKTSAIIFWQAMPQRGVFSLGFHTQN